jgi:GTP-binding protein
VDFKFNNMIRAENGLHGSGGNKTGKRGKDALVTVPAGTVIKTHPEERLIKDLSVADLRFAIARGGRGGRGNARFKSSVNRTPTRRETGRKGEKITVVLELKLIAFAGLVGLPNAGKSTLISRLSQARPKIADYPFTTLSPGLGVVYHDYESLVIADIPGIIEGAHSGEGMGLDFLKHVERNEVLIFIIDLSESAPIPPLEAYKILQSELKTYKSTLLKKKKLVVGNKIDLLDGDPQNGGKNLATFCKQAEVPYVEISALKRLNLEAFKKRLFKLYHEK